MRARIIQARKFISRLITARPIIANDSGDTPIGQDYNFADYSNADYS